MFSECRKFISEALTLLKLLRGQIQNVRHAQLYRLKLSNITRCINMGPNLNLP